MGININGHNYTDEITIKFLEFCKPKELGRLSRVCRAFNRLIDEKLWETIFKACYFAFSNENWKPGLTWKDKSRTVALLQEGKGVSKVLCNYLSTRIPDYYAAKQVSSLFLEGNDLFGVRKTKPISLFRDESDILKDKMNWFDDLVEQVIESNGITIGLSLGYKSFFILNGKNVFRANAFTPIKRAYILDATTILAQHVNSITLFENNGLIKAQLPYFDFVGLPIFGAFFANDQLHLIQYNSNESTIVHNDLENNRVTTLIHCIISRPVAKSFENKLLLGVKGGGVWKISLTENPSVSMLHEPDVISTVYPILFATEDYIFASFTETSVLMQWDANTDLHLRTYHVSKNFSPIQMVGSLLISDDLRYIDLESKETTIKRFSIGEKDVDKKKRNNFDDSLPQTCRYQVITALHAGAIRFFSTTQYRHSVDPMEVRIVELKDA